jgi:hypothetical protein
MKGINKMSSNILKKALIYTCLFFTILFISLLIINIFSNDTWLEPDIDENNIPEVPEVPKKNEIVMSEGMMITVNTSVGTMKITAGKGSKRSYSWEGATRFVIMLPRHERWYGSLGIYYPGPGNHWKNHKGIRRAVVEEGQQHFVAVDEALKWIDSRAWMPHVYTDDGLVVGWEKTPSRDQLNVDVWQIYINGEKPANLPGSQNDKVIVENKSSRPKAISNE